MLTLSTSTASTSSIITTAANQTKGTRSQVVVAGAIAGLVSRYHSVAPFAL